MKYLIAFFLFTQCLFAQTSRFDATQKTVFVASQTTPFIQTNSTSGVTNYNIVPGAILYWPLTNNLTDYGSYALGATSYGSPTFSGGQLPLDGSIPQVVGSATSSWPTNGITISFWYNMSQTNVDQQLFQIAPRADGSGRRFIDSYFLASAGATVVTVYDANINFHMDRSAVAVTTNTLVNYVITFNGSFSSNTNIQIYTNGVQADSNGGTVNSPSQMWNGTTFNAWLGAQTSSGSSAFTSGLYANGVKGALIYSNVLTASQILSNYQAGAIGGKF